MSFRHLPWPAPTGARCIVVRPSVACCRYCGHTVHPTQTLLICKEEVQDLDLNSEQVKVSSIPLQGTHPSDLSCATYEPTTNCVVLVERKSILLLLDSDNSVSILAGKGDPPGIQERADGQGTSARFSSITALVADGLGHLYVAEPECIRKVVVSTGEVSTLQESSPQQHHWVGLAYDAIHRLLLAATKHAVCTVSNPTRSTSSEPGSPQPRLQVVAGAWNFTRNVYGSVPSSVVGQQITSILAGPARRLCVLDNARLKQLDLNCDGSSSLFCTDLTVTFQSDSCSMTALPSGELAICGARFLTLASVAGSTATCFAASSAALGGQVSLKRKREPAADILAQLEVPIAVPPSPAGGEAAAGAGAAGGAGAGGGSGVVTVRFDDGKGFLAHRSLLSAHSDYFQQLLAEGGGFADSGAAEVRLRDTTAEVFGCLLAYMYGNPLVVPDELARPAAELAGRLLMRVECTAQLQTQLLAAVTPGSVVSDLVWAQQHNMTELVPRLKAFLMRNRKKVAFGAGVELAAKFPELAAELLQLMAST